MPGSAFRRVLCQLPGREQVVLVSRDFPTAILSPPSPGELNSSATSIPSVVAIDWAPLQVYAPMTFPWCSETMIFFAFPSCTDLRNLIFFHLPPPLHFLFFPGLFLILHQLPNLVHCGTVWTAEWAQWEGREQGDGERKDRQDGGKTTEDNTFAEINVNLCF